MRHLKVPLIIIAFCLITLLAGCGKEVNKFTTTESDNEDTLVETASTSEENFEVALSDSAEESPQAVVASNESVDISSSEEDEQTVSLYTFEGDYTTILDGTYDLIANWDGQNYLNSPYALVGLDEFIFQNDCSVDERLSLIGYMFADINDDGSEELLIGPVDDDNHSISGICEIYTMVDEKTILVKEGWLRNRVYLLEDNTIYNEWDDGAAHWGINTYTLNPETGDRRP